jgi:hypothetical protein
VDAISNLGIGDDEGHFIPLAQLADIQDEGHGLPNTSDSYFAAGNTNVGFTPTCGSMIISFWFGLRQEMGARHQPAVQSDGPQYRLLFLLRRLGLWLGTSVVSAQQTLYRQPQLFQLSSE